jgi:hypothetical protein
MFRAVKNNVLSKAVDDSLNSIANPVSFNVTSGEGAKFPFPLTDGSFWVTVWGDSYVDPNSAPDYEIMLCTERVGDLLTCSRAQQGSVGRAWTGTPFVGLLVTAGNISEIQDSLETISDIGWFISEDTRVWNKNALLFNGVDDFVTVVDIINGLAACSWSAWVKWDGTAGVKTPLRAKTLVGDNPCVGILITDGGVTVGLSTSVSDNIQAGTATLTADVWTHVMGIYDGSFLYCYINGVQSGTSTAVTGTVKTPEDITIGASNNTGANSFSGIIDQVKIWQKALNSTEIENDYLGVRVDSDLIGEWLFNGGTEILARDSSGAGNHGTISGAKYIQDIPVLYKE